MQIAVVTPYHTENIDILRSAHRSVLAQSMKCRHIIVADGSPKLEIAGWDCEHIILPTPHGAGGDFPRGIGALHAIHQGATYVAFLDADNWFEPDHVASLVELARRERAVVAFSRRALVRPDGSLLEAMSNEPFIDTNTYLFHRAAYDILALWATLPRELNPIGDQIIGNAIRRRGYRTVGTGRPTVNYRTRYIGDYVRHSEEPPEGAFDNSHRDQAIAFWRRMDRATRHRILYGTPRPPSASGSK